MDDMLQNLGLFGLFLGCLISATVIPFSSEDKTGRDAVLARMEEVCFPRETAGEP